MKRTIVVVAVVCLASLGCSGPSAERCVEKAPCSLAEPCRRGEIACADANARCVDVGPAVDGEVCAGGVCVAGACEACAQGAACEPPGRPCRVGVVSCTGAPACLETGAELANGTTCDGEGTCSAGECLRTVVVTRSVTWWTEDGPSAPVPDDLTQSTTQALVATVDGYRVFPSVEVAPGRVEIPGVPTGAYLLEVSGSTGRRDFTEESASAVDLSFAVAGRPDAAIGSEPTTLTWELTGLAPWRAGDLLVATCSSHVSWPLFGSASEGTTSVTLVDEWSGAPLIDGGKGDRVYVAQLGEIEGLPELGVARAAVRAGALPDTFRIRDGVDQTIAAALGPIAATGTLRAEWDLAAFEGLVGGMGPGVMLESQWLQVEAWAFDLDSDATTPLLQLARGAPYGGTLSVGPLVYARPLPDSWKEHVFVMVDVAAERLVGVGSWPMIYRARAVLAPEETAIRFAPEIGPPTAVRVDGRDAFTPQSGVGVTPVITWSPPALGAALSYYVRVVEAFPYDGYFRTRASFNTSSTTLAIPPGVLMPGGVYFLVIAAQGARGSAPAIGAEFTP